MDEIDLTMPPYFLFFPNTTSTRQPGISLPAVPEGIAYVYVLGIASGKIISAQSFEELFRTGTAPVDVVSISFSYTILLNKDSL